MSDPKDTPLRPQSEDNWGVGQMDDGSIDSFPESELADRRMQRDADEAELDAMLDDDEFEAASQPQAGDDPDDVYEAE